MKTGVYAIVIASSAISLATFLYIFSKTDNVQDEHKLEEIDASFYSSFFDISTWNKEEVSLLIFGFNVVKNLTLN